MASNADSLEGRVKSKFLDSKDSLISDLVKLPENFAKEIKKSLNELSGGVKRQKPIEYLDKHAEEEKSITLNATEDLKEEF